jgi:hypothetical protein
MSANIAAINSYKSKRPEAVRTRRTIRIIDAITRVSRVSRVKIDAGRLKLNLLSQIALSLREYAIDQIEQF